MKKYDKEIKIISCGLCNFNCSKCLMKNENNKSSLK
jgi:hypothetical protein|nr:MAG TPA: Radical SAM superfamily [Caudoviricetes sp.]